MVGPLAAGAAGGVANCLRDAKPIRQYAIMRDPDLLRARVNGLAARDATSQLKLGQHDQRSRPIRRQELTPFTASMPPTAASIRQIFG